MPCDIMRVYRQLLSRLNYIREQNGLYDNPQSTLKQKITCRWQYLWRQSFIIRVIENYSRLSTHHTLNVSDLWASVRYTFCWLPRCFDVSRTTARRHLNEASTIGLSEQTEYISVYFSNCTGVGARNLNCRQDVASWTRAFISKPLSKPRAFLVSKIKTAVYSYYTLANLHVVLNIVGLYRELRRFSKPGRSTYFQTAFT